MTAWAAPASANALSAVAQSWGPMGDIRYPPEAHQPSCNTSGGAVVGVPGPVFGSGTVGGIPTRQYVIGTAAPFSLPAGATLVGGTLSGAVVASSVGGSVAPPGPATFAAGFGFASSTGWGVCPSMNPSVDVSVNLPGNNDTSVPFGVDAYSLLQSMFRFWGATGADLALTSGTWMAPIGPMALTAAYAFTPSSVAAEAVAQGSGTQAAVTWSPDGNDASTVYQVQREAFDTSGAVSTWQTLFQGVATGFQTTDQVCGTAYVYRVAAVGSDAATPWAQSPEWDAFPCTVAASDPTSDTLTVTWPEVSAGAQPVIVWCPEAGPGGAVSCQQADMPLGSGTTSATLSGLLPNTEYALWVCSGTDMWGCPETNAWTLPAIPGTLEPGAEGRGVPPNAQPFTWSPGGNPVGTVYQLVRQVWSGGWSAPEVVYSGTDTGAVASQSPGNSYLYTVQALGASPSIATPAVPIQVAGTPTLSITGPNSATVSWSAVEGMSSTWVGCSASGSGTWTTEGTVTGGATRLDMSDLLPDTPYTCAIAATASNAGIPWWQGSPSDDTDAVPPGVPVVSAATQTSLRIGWSADGNPAGTQYEVHVADGSGGVADDQVVTALAVTVSSLQPGARYLASVRAENASGAWTPWIASPATAWTVPAEPVAAASGRGLGWSAQGGRGDVVLTWAAVPGATGYTVWVFDGSQYEAFDAGDTTTWDTGAAHLYPPDAGLYPAVAAGTKGPPILVHNQGGLDLRDSPVNLYCTVDIGCAGGTTAYRFSVSAHDSAGDSAQFDVPGTDGATSATVTLPLQTDQVVPTMTLTLSAGTSNGYALGPKVHALLTAGSGPSGVAAYALSDDGTTWVTRDVYGCSVGQVEACGTAMSVDVPWTVTAGPGTKTVWAKVESTAGLWSAPSMATIYVAPDTVPPTVDITLDGGSATTTDTAVGVATTVTDPLAQEAGLSFSARYSADGGQNWTAWSPVGAATSWTATVEVPGGASGPRTVLEQVEDSDLNVGQGGATIAYVGAGGGTLPSAGRPRACSWMVGDTVVPATCVVDSQVDAPTQAPPGAIEMRVSLDDVAWGPWQAIAPKLAIDLGPTPGAHTVWIEYRDALDAVTATRPMYFVFDPGAPAVSASWAGGASATDADGHATLLVQASDDVGRTASMTLQVTENGAVLYHGAATSTIPLVLSGSGFQLVSVEVADAGGNVASSTVGIYVEQPNP